MSISQLTSVKIGLSSIVVEVHSIKSENHPNSFALIRDDDDSPRLTNFSSELGFDGRVKSLVTFSSETAISKFVVDVGVIVVVVVSDAIVFIFVLVLLLIIHDVRWLC
uniref:Putative ovule protein n=1 Tax=Solanum chacoense TaxID=4108 RepID=A0A0V0GT69_SOLCH